MILMQAIQASHMPDVNIALLASITSVGGISTTKQNITFPSVNDELVIHIQPSSVICPQINREGLRGRAHQFSHPLRRNVVAPIRCYGTSSPVKLHLAY